MCFGANLWPTVLDKDWLSGNFQKQVNSKNWSLFQQEEEMASERLEKWKIWLLFSASHQLLLVRLLESWIKVHSTSHRQVEKTGQGRKLYSRLVGSCPDSGHASHSGISCLIPTQKEYKYYCTDEQSWLDSSDDAPLIHLISKLWEPFLSHDLVCLVSSFCPPKSFFFIQFRSSLWVLHSPMEPIG